MKVKMTFGIYDDAYFRVSRYKADHALFVGLHSHSEGPLANITVCLGDRDLQENESYVDVNNFPEVLDFILENELGTPTGKLMQSGYVTYPVVAFDMNKLCAGDAILSEEVRACI